MDDSDLLDLVSKCRRATTRKCEHESKIVRELTPRLWGFFSRYFKLNHQTDDLVQDTLCEILLNLDKFEPRGRFISWCLVIAHNKAIDSLRRITRERDAMEQLRRHVEADDGTNREMASEATSVLESVLTNLDTYSRNILVMRHLDGMEYKDIGTIVGKTGDAVRMELNRLMPKVEKMARDLLK